MVVATFYFVYWVPFALLPGVHWGVAAVISYACAMAAGWYAWTRTATVAGSLARSMGYWALVIGAIGFVGGFFGPMLFAPGANQGPLLGSPDNRAAWRARRRDRGAGPLAGTAQAERFECHNVT